jgi:hypothetical protein
MSTDKKELTQAEQYLSRGFEVNEHGVYIYTSTNGNHHINLADILEDYHHEQKSDQSDIIREMDSEIQELKGEKEELERDLKEANEQVSEMEDEAREAERSSIEEDPEKQTLFGEKKLEILRRMYKFLTLEELEVMEAPVKDRVGYLDINY